MKSKLFAILLVAALLTGSVASLAVASDSAGPLYLPMVKKGPSGGSGFEAPAPLPALSTLAPGVFQEIEQDLKLNVVFVGYEQGAGALNIDQAAFLAGLPAAYQPVHRAQESWYGLPGYFGLKFNFDYNLVYANTAFEDAYFDYLGSIATSEPLTLFQASYNSQANKSLTIPDNYWIDAPSAEQWLADNTQTMLGVDTSEYTIFFVNWYGRPDFKFHVYTKIGEPDPETGYDFGLNRDSRKLIAWGGTTPDDEETGLGSLHRIWFYDLSAGPEGWTDNWNVDDADLDGSGAMDYRMPPVWEYGNLSGYRPFDDLSGDLAKIARFVAIDLLFTTSPLYKPAISPPALPQDIQVDINVFQMNPGDDGTVYFDPALINQELNELQPLNTYSTEITSHAAVSRFMRVYMCFFNDQTCFGNRMFGVAFADLFLFFQDQLMQYLEGDSDYELPIFAFNTTDDLQTCCLGFADDNWADGTQSFVFAWDAPFLRDLGYGFSTTVIHEAGHHIGMSHPHDGYDSESGVDFGPGDDYYFAWSGDESNTIMSYMDLNWDFSQFDRDNMARYQTVDYINQANTILSWIAKSPKAGQVGSLLTSADAHAGMALSEYDAMNYASAASHAKMAYEDIVTSAGMINVKVEVQSWQADYKAKGKSGKFIDPVDYQRNKP